MTVKIDLKKGSTWQRTKNGDRATRIAHISGVTGNIDALLKNALDDAQMPQYGDAHPQDSTITVQTITVSALSGDVYEARIEYYDDPASAAGSSNASASVSSAATTEQVRTDIAGNPLETDYWIPDGSGVSHVYPTFIAEVERTRTTFDFEYTTSTFPKTEHDTYKNKINSTIWNGYAVGTILCAGISINQMGSEYRVRFSFSLNENGWSFAPKVGHATLLMSQGDDLLLDITTGIRPFDVYEEVDFSPLGFTL